MTLPTYIFTIFIVMLYPDPCNKLAEFLSLIF